MTSTATFTKRVGRSRANYVIWVPRDVAVLLELRADTILEVAVRKVGGGGAS